MDAAAKQQIIERVKQANNILVTVSNDPSVDQLAACIGLTLLLNRMDKHATAVFSGKVPSTLEFLQPEKTIETNTDSLRDFIISLDKNKADKLRYKVEDQVVRIFITPYKSSLSESDLVFSQGDFNVEVVIALGVTDRGQIDAAITAHGKILHDATVISLNAGQGKAPEVGQINWQDPVASSLSEMVVSVSEAFGTGLIDNQMATAFLTGIVAETNRFSNKKTTPKVMTMSAQLMAAGANQQLIVSKLEPPVVNLRKPTAPINKPSAGDLQAQIDDGTLNIPHDNKPTGGPNLAADEIHIDEKGNLITAAPALKPQEQLPPELPSTAPAPMSPPPAPSQPVAQTATPPPPTTETPPAPHAFLANNNQPPFMAGNAFTANAQPEWADPYNSVNVDPLSENQNPIPQTPPPVDQARSAVQSALASNGSPPPTPRLPDQPNPQPQTPPPPFPPPITPTQGVIIPTNSTSHPPAAG